MTVGAEEIIKRLDERSEYMEDGELWAWLYEESLAYELENPVDIRGIAALWNELGGIARRNRWLEKGERVFLKAKEALESAGIRDGNYATTINNLAGHYRVAGDFERSAEYFSLCRELYEAMPELPVDVLASVCNNLGLLHLDAKRYEKAMEEFVRAGEMIISIPENHYVQAVTAGNRAYAHYGLGERDAAREWMGRAAVESEKIEGPEGELCRHYRRLFAQLGGSL